MTDLKKIEKSLSPIEEKILSVISTDNISSPFEISELTGIDEKTVIEILNRDDFYSLICAKSIANMRLAYHSKAIPGLIQRLDTDKDFFDAHDRLSKAIGAVSSRDGEGMKVSLEVLLKKADTTNRTLHNIPVPDREGRASDKGRDLNSVSKLQQPIELRKSGNIFALDETEDKPILSHIDFERSNKRNEMENKRNEMEFEWDDEE